MENHFDACDLQLLGLRTTVEVLKQLPVVLEAKSVDKGDWTFYSPDENVRRAAAFAPAPLMFPLSALKGCADARRDCDRCAEPGFLLNLAC
eukprot:COSAG04_NODE_442_length_14382_cov_72.823566_12_plen_91_part_00